jgi:hypothetical protein
MGSPDVLSALKYANRTGKSRAISEGYGGFKNGVDITPDGRVKFLGGKNGVPAYPNLQFWDYTKRALDDAAGAAIRDGRKDAANRLSTQARMLRDELDKAVPSFKEARAGAAAFFGAQDALEAGQKFIGTRIALSDAAKARNAMSDPEKRLFAEGFADSLIRKVAQTGDRRDVVNKIFGSRDAQARMHIALGPKRYKEMEAYLRVESAMDLARKAQGNSTTTRQLIEAGIVGEGYNYLTNDSLNPLNPKAMMTALLYGATRRGIKGIGNSMNAKVMNRVAEMLVSDDPKIHLNGIKAIANNKTIMERLRMLGAVTGTAAGQAAADWTP